MSLIFTDSFAGGDTYWGGKYDVNTGVLPAADGGARTNGYIGYSNGSNHRTLTKIVTAAEEHQTFVAGMALKKGAVTGTAHDVMAFLSDGGATTHITIVITPYVTGGIAVHRGTSAGLLLGQYLGSVMPVASTWYYLEVKVTLSDTVGAVEVLIDDLPVLNLTGLDTKNGGTKTVLDAMSWKLGVNGVSQDQINDVYLCNGAGAKNNDFLLSPRVFWLRPNGNGNSSQGVGSDGNSTDNYLLVDDPPGFLPDQSDYVDLVNTGNKDTYVYTDVTGIDLANEVYGVVACPYASKTDAGARTLTAVARSGGVELDSAAAALDNGTFKTRKGVLENKPGGGSWTVADLNGMEFGVKATA